MKLQNREQIRAKHALGFAQKVASGKVKATGKEGGDAMKKIPPMIMANGLLAAIAFAIEQTKDRKSGQMVARSEGHQAIFDAIAEHLASEEIDITAGVSSARQLIDHLAGADSHTLKLATAEALEWLGYARRFLTGGDSEDDHS